jgi:hypothetical protein
LNATKTAPHRARERVRQDRLSNARNILNQRVTTREQTDDQAVHGLHISHVDGNNVRPKRGNSVLHRKSVTGCNL